MTPDPLPSHRPLSLVLPVWLALWALAALASFWLVPALGWAIPADGHAGVHAHGHAFIDTRSWAGLPNAMDVLSNLAFLAMAGLAWRHAAAAPWPSAWRALAWALGLTAAGSTVYHWAPAPLGLLLDRIGMAAAFAAVVAIAVAERWSPALARPLGALVLGAGLGSAVLAWSHALALAWVVLQFGGLLCLCAAAATRPLKPGPAVRWGVLVTMYLLAKLFELADTAVFEATQGLVAGHALKHLIAALAVWPIVAIARLGQNASPRPATEETA